MSFKPDPSFAPEFVLADLIIRRIPRAEWISREDLGRAVLWEYAGERQVFNKYFPIALETLLEEKHIKDKPNENGGIEYSLSTSGRGLQDSDGYLPALKEKQEKELRNKKSAKAESNKKIFD